MRFPRSAASLATVLVLATAASSYAEERHPGPPKPPGPVGTLPSESETQVGYLGVGLDEVDDALAYHLNLENDLGVMVSMVGPKSPAQIMGIKRFDVIVAMDGKPIYTPRAIQNLIRAKKPGEMVDITVRRGAASETVSGPVSGRAEMPDEGRPGLGRRLPGGGEMPPRRGKMAAPDGGTMEWSVEESP